MGPTFRDRLGSILMLAFIAVLWVQRSYTTPFGGIFPDRVMMIMTVLIVVTLILSFTRYRTMGEEQKDAETGEKRWSDMTVVIVILMAWALLLRYAGFALTSVVGFASIAWYISGERKNWKMIIKAILVALAITYLIVFTFGHLLHVPLPEGEIFD
jgi:predicted CDP-diglyceride synthetase/phosphatidate cytidylyltransferase